MKQAFALALAIVACSIAPAFAEVGVPVARDLQKDAALARDKKGVVLVLFAAEDCSYCETVLKEFLIPMSRNAEYQSKVVMRVVEQFSYQEMKDFRGSKTVQRHFAGDKGARFFPTVMVFDSNGKLLAKPVVGLSTIDYYGESLDQAIDKGIAKVRGLKTVN